MEQEVGIKIIIFPLFKGGSQSGCQATEYDPGWGDISAVHGYHSTTSTSYYVIFEVESGAWMEFSVYGEEYGMLAEGDEGKLTFQGSRYLGFERTIEN